MMDPGKIEISLEVVMPWWFKPYLYTLAFLCAVMGTQPDYEKFQAFVAKHIRFRFKGK